MKGRIATAGNITETADDADETAEDVSDGEARATGAGSPPGSTTVLLSIGSLLVWIRGRKRRELPIPSPDADTTEYCPIRQECGPSPRERRLAARRQPIATGHAHARAIVSTCRFSPPTMRAAPR